MVDCVGSLLCTLFLGSSFVPHSVSLPFLTLFLVLNACNDRLPYLMYFNLF